MSSPALAPYTTQDGFGVLREVESRVLWLSTAIIHHANRVRANPSGLKVGGHQASSASMVSIMTALWFRHLRPQDRVSVKPHAAPVLHAINYLLGELDEAQLPRLREFGGLQSYPSRSKDPDPVDYSTGSVGIGATAPIWGALSRRYVNATIGDVGTGRQFSLLGDAELDEGAVWEAVLDPAVGDLGEVVWVVDLNRQSLDRVVPDIAADKLQGMFTAAGWQVITLKYGRLLEELFLKPGGEELRQRIEVMTNPEYQRLLRCDAGQLRRRLPEGPGADRIRALVDQLDDSALVEAIANLGGHDLHALDAAFSLIDDSRPTVIFAYTIKGYGLATRAHPQNHSALLTEEQMAELADRLGADPAHPWRAFDEGTEAQDTCLQAAQRLRRSDTLRHAPPPVPTDIGRTPSGTATTQAALGRVLLDLTRAAPDVAARVVTVSPDVSSSTNLGGWVNKVGVWSSTERRDWFADDAETVLHWRERPSGQHMELGIAETNLVGLIGELGACWSRWGSRSYRSVCCTTPSWNAPLSLGPSVSTRADSPFWSARPPGSLWHRKAARTSRSRPRPSDWNNPAVSPTNRRSPSMPSGPCSPPWPGSADRTAAPRMCGCRRGQSTRHWPRCPRTRPRGSAADAKSSPVRIPWCAPQAPRSPSPRWARWCRRRWQRSIGWHRSASRRTLCA